MVLSSTSDINWNNMKINWSKIFSIAVSDAEYFGDNENKIEVKSCKKNQMACIIYLPEINRFLKESDIFYRERDFNRSVEALENAYNKTLELHQAECFKCAELFRETIIDTLEVISAELQEMGKGLFSSGRYRMCTLKVNKILKSYKDTGDSTTSDSFHKLEKEECIY